MGRFRGRLLENTVCTVEKNIMPSESPLKDSKPDVCVWHLCLQCGVSIKNIILIFPGVVPSLKPIGVMFMVLTSARQYKNMLKTCENDMLVSFAILLTAVSVCRSDTASVLYADARSPSG